MTDDVARLRPSHQIRAYAFARRLKVWAFTRFVRSGFAHFGTGSSIAGPAGISGAAEIWIGSQAAIGPHCLFRILGPSDDGRPRIRIGDRVAIVGWCAISSVDSVEIGAGALLARGVYIADHTHVYDDPDRAIRDQGIGGAAPVRIGEGSWLGENVVILPGVTVGRGAVVGANSVVRRDVAPHTAVAGVPARVIKSWAPASDAP